MFHFPDSDTGYYDTEEAFYALDAEHEAAEERAYLEEIEASHGCEFDARPIVPLVDIDPETGCTAAEMEEKGTGWVPACPMEREIYDDAHRGGLLRAVPMEGKVA